MSTNLIYKQTKTRVWLCVLRDSLTLSGKIDTYEIYVITEKYTYLSYCDEQKWIGTKQIETFAAND